MKIALVGAGGHAKVVCTVARRLGYGVLGYIDDGRPVGSMLLDAPVLQGLEQFQNLNYDCDFFICFGQNTRRAALFERFSRLGCQFATLIDPSARIMADVELGKGTVVMPGALILPGATVGDNCILNTKCSLGGGVRIEDNVHICPGASISTSALIRRGAMVGTGATVSAGCIVGEGAVVGAGAAVLADVASGVTVAGVPARSVSHKE